MYCQYPVDYQMNHYDDHPYEIKSEETDDNIYAFPALPDIYATPTNEIIVSNYDGNNSYVFNETSLPQVNNYHTTTINTYNFNIKAEPNLNINTTINNNSINISEEKEHSNSIDLSLPNEYDNNSNNNSVSKIEKLKLPVLNENINLMNDENDNMSHNSSTNSTYQNNNNSIKDNSSNISGNNSLSSNDLNYSSVSPKIILNKKKKYNRKNNEEFNKNRNKLNKIYNSDILDINKSNEHGGQLNVGWVTFVKNSKELQTMLSDNNTHISTNSIKKSYKCPVCYKFYQKKNGLIAHFRIHSKYAFRCDTCGKTFARKRNKDEHKRLHTGEKPFSCNLCHRRFTQMHCLKEHSKSKH